MANRKLQIGNIKNFTIELLAISYLLLAGPVLAINGGGNINPNNVNSERYAWNDVTGWLDFDTGSVTVGNTNLVGTASGLQFGNLVLNCSSLPTPDCSTAGNWFVSNDGSGNLAGWAWNDNLGWFSFCGNASGGSTYNGSTWVCPASPTYQVTIDTSGVFSGWAWNDVIGGISFNCSNQSSCGTSDYKVRTSWGAAPVPNNLGPGGFDSNTWLISSVLNTQVAGGAGFNNIFWQGIANGGQVGFQLATSNSASGPWTASDFHGPDGSVNSIYTFSGPNTQLSVDQAQKLRRNHNNAQYVRYKVYLLWVTGSQSPRVDDVIISYSP